VLNGPDATENSDDPELFEEVPPRAPQCDFVAGQHSFLDENPASILKITSRVTGGPD
jgi:hypothetical protein